MIKLRTLNLEELNCKDKDGHYSLKQRLSTDEAVYRYVSKRFDTWIEEPKEKEQYEVGKTYVITNNNQEQIGMCGSTKFTPNGVIDFWVAIDKQQRKKGYGEKIAVQITEYFLENIEGLKDISFVINKYNHRSNKVALLSGYTLTDTKDDKNYYRYFG